MQMESAHNHVQLTQVKKDGTPRQRVVKAHNEVRVSARGNSKKLGLLVTLEHVSCTLHVGWPILCGWRQEKTEPTVRRCDSTPLPSSRPAMVLDDVESATNAVPPSPPPPPPYQQQQQQQGCLRLRQQQIQVLTDVTVAFEPGHLTALLGPSGSGKTTLLDVTSGRKTRGRVSGAIRFSGVVPTNALLKRETAYVEQSDTLIPALTVTEMLMYQSELKRGTSEGLGPKRERVNDLMERLGLLACASTKIGSYLDRGISGGQARRVNIALALVTDPSVLFLDEPTSGLDSTTSFEVCGILRGIADGGRTVISTIHSPSAEAFRLFDDVALLARGGRVAYFGAVSRSLDFVEEKLAESRLSSECSNSSDVEDFDVVDDEESNGNNGRSLSKAPSNGSLGQVSIAEVLLVSVADREAADALCDAYATSALATSNLHRIKVLLGALPKDKQGLVALYGRRAAKTLLRAEQELIISTSSSPFSIIMGDGETSDRSDAQSDSSTGTSITTSTSNVSVRKVATSPSIWRKTRRRFCQFFRRETHTSSLTATRVMLKYRMWANLKDVRWVAARCAPLFFAFVVSSLFYQSATDVDARGLMNTSALLFMVAALPALAAGGYMPSIVEERGLFYRERADGCYSTGAYLIYKLLEEGVMTCVMTTSFAVIIFYSVNAQGSVLYFILMCLVTAFVGVVLAYLVAALCPTANAANTVLPVYITVHLFVIGLLLDPLPVYARWFADVAFLRYTWRGLMLNQFGEGGMKNPLFGFGGILEFYHLDESVMTMWEQLGMVGVFFFFYLIATYMALAYVRHIKR
mmetsp:Transcript_6067/g.15685  ORF Transcript_6067/g.15685 Transcript_6067/m.15685 type:complete len:806 (-) Transcript_6067:656-3073(-)